jgi:transcriptional regulator with XRE-family HTH domain
MDNQTSEWMDKEKLGQTLRLLRLTNNLSLRDLAEKSGISYSFISSIEKGRFSPSRDTIIALGQALIGADTNELLMLAGFAPYAGLVKEENALYEPEVQFILRAKRELTPRAFKTFMRIAEQTKKALEDE